MYQYLNCDGDGYCVIDHDKLLILQLDEEALWELLVYDKAEIRGLQLSDINFKERWFGASQCDWADGENIFLKANRLVVGDNGRFTIWSKDQPLNGVVDRSDEFAVVFQFDFGMFVPIMKSDFDELLSGDVKRVVATLKKLSEKPVDCGWTMREYESARNSEELLAVVTKMVAAGKYPIHD